MSELAPTRLQVTSFYHFVSLTPDMLQDIKRGVESLSSDGLRGLLVVGTEGFNGTVCGLSPVIEKLRAVLRDLLGDLTVPFKDSWCDKQPFTRLKVDIRPEIITAKNQIELNNEDSYLSPKEWHDIISKDPDVILVDTRNFYEVELGKFDGAIDPKMDKFSDWPAYLNSADIPKDKKILLYCTGGIRCEKALPEMKRRGYQKVYQLHGGILDYLAKYPNGHFKGECFVFDHRVAVDQDLNPTSKFKLCPHCGNPASQRVNCDNCETDAVVCDKCLNEVGLKACSKNCAYHLYRKPKSKRLIKTEESSQQN